MSDMDVFAALDRHGGDLDRWPPDLAERARRAEVHDPAFREALAEARALDAFIAEAMTVPEPPLGYATRITARAVEAGRAAQNRFGLRWLFALGSGWAVAATAAGLVTANILAQTDPELLSFAEIALGTAQIVSGN